MKMNTTQVTIILALLLCAGRADALIDSDMDGMSDLWERQYGFSTTDDGTLHPDQAPDRDADQDGQSNRDESIAGTDPNDAGSAERFGMQVVHNQTTGQLHTQIRAVRGKYYELFVSDDLETWTSGGLLKHTAPSGTTDLPNSADPAQIPHRFWKLEVRDHDEDGDGLSNYEEALQGTDMTAVSDANANTIADEWELAWLGGLGGSAQSDADADGIFLIDEYRYGLNPTADDAAQLRDHEHFAYDYTRLTAGNKAHRFELIYHYDPAGNLTEVTE